MMFSMNHKLKIIPIPAFKDNYIWLIHNGEQAIVVDPGDAKPVLMALEQLNLTLQAILVTHHHKDHINGISALINHFPNIQVYAPTLGNYAFKHTPINEPDILHFKNLNLSFSVLAVPGHTLGHIAYYAQYNNAQAVNEKLLFCGDTLFGAGCGRLFIETENGRLFEGKYTQLYQSLQKLAQLPAETKVYCTHEYTLHNINFALSIEPNNQALIKRHIETKQKRDLNMPSLPSTIALELATNPFLRCQSNEIKTSIPLKNMDALEVFRTIRELRNHY